MSSLQKVALGMLNPIAGLVGDCEYVGAAPGVCSKGHKQATSFVLIVLQNRETTTERWPKPFEPSVLVSITIAEPCVLLTRYQRQHIASSCCSFALTRTIANDL